MSTSNSQPAYFLVTCFGNSASTWYGKTLNMHPDIVCSHGPVEPTIGLEYEREQTPEETANAIPYAAKFLSRKISETFQEIVDYEPGAKVYGSVQGYRIGQVANISKKYPDESLELQCVNLVRHPVNWVMSTAANFIRQTEVSLLMRHELLNAAKSQYSLYTDWAKQADKDPLSWDNLAFFAACLYMHTLMNDFDIANKLNVPFILKEEITTDPDKFKEATAFVTANKIDISDEFVDQAMGAGVVNSHQQKPSLTPKEQWQRWDEHQRHLFTQMANSARIKPAYEKLGYDFNLD